MVEVTYLRDEVEQMTLKLRNIANKLNIYKGMKDSVYNMEGNLNDAEKVLMHNLNGLINNLEMKYRTLNIEIENHKQEIDQLLG